jgi:hypothetical protein
MDADDISHDIPVLKLDRNMKRKTMLDSKWVFERGRMKICGWQKLLYRSPQYLAIALTLMPVSNERRS